MSASDLLRFAIKALLGHRLRSGLSLLGMGVGVATVILLTALGKGARMYVSNQFANIGSNLLIIVPGKTETTGALPRPVPKLSCAPQKVDPALIARCD